MRNLIALLSLFFTFGLTGQQTIVFHENFDSPSGADSVTVSSSAGTNPILWNDTSFLSVSPNHSFHLQGSAGAIVSFETQAFSTVGAQAVILNFNHIAKVSYMNQCKLFISVDNGLNWVQADTGDYKGNAGFGSKAFNSSSYFHENDLWNMTQSTTPTSSWWRGETFDLTSKTTHPITGLGYAQVKIKFEGNLSFLPPNGYEAGWFVDDVQVITAPCEFTLPSISMRNTGTPNCSDSLLSGAFYNPLSFSRSSVFHITDNVDIDSVRVLEIINGIPGSYTSLTSSNSYYTHTFTGYGSLDTIQWMIEAYDTCGNIGRFPATGYHEFWFEPSISKCAAGDCNSAHSFIDNLPWNEDFDGGGWSSGTNARGQWPSGSAYEVVPPLPNQNGWSVKNGPTPTLNTGPQGDNTSGSGNYLYTKFDNVPLGYGSQFILPCIDLTDSASKTLSFYYHMYGADINNLRIDIDSTSGTVANWQQLFKIIGPQHNGSADPWKKMTLSLEAYKGKILKIRFLGNIHPNTQGLGDIAIDDLEIVNAPPYDVELLDLHTPNLNACAGSSNLPVEIDVFNNGFTNLTSVPVAYQLDNAAIVRDTITPATFALGDTVNFTFTQNLTFNPNQAHTFKVWTDLSGDANRGTDTVTLNIPIMAGMAINSFPYFFNFENATVTPGGTGSLNTPQWTLNTGTAGTDAYWGIEKGYLRDFPDNVFSGHGKEATCMVLKRKASSTDYAQMESSCIDLTNLTAPVLDFQYYRNPYATLDVMIKEPGQNWQVLSNVSISPAPPANAKPWMEGIKISLNSYAGKIIHIAFRAHVNSVKASVAIDDIAIREAPANDMALRKTNFKRLQEGTTSLPSIITDFTFFGRAPLLSFYGTLKLQLIDKCDPSAPIITGQSDSLLIPVVPSIPFNGSKTFNNIIFSQAVPEGDYLVKGWIDYSADDFRANDTAYFDVACRSRISIPYFNDFEDCSAGVFLRGGSSQWEIATPQKPQISSAFSGTKCAITNADTSAFSTFVEILQIPEFTGLDTLYAVEVRLRQNFDFGLSNADYGIVEIFDGQGWKQLDNPTITGTNWTALMKPVAGPHPVGFTGSSNGWIYSSYPLVEYSTSAAHSIRFLTTATDVPGWAIDDFEIHVPIQNSGSPKSLTFNSPPVDGSNTVALKLENTGAAPLSEIEIFIEDNGTVIHNETITFSNPVLRGKSTTVQLSGPLNLVSTMQQLLIRTALPNTYPDMLPDDDTLIVPLMFTSTVSSMPSCFEFENNPVLVPFDFNTGAMDTNWVRGLPAKTQINTAHSGTNAWFIKDSSYSRLLDQYIYSPIYNLKANSCYRLSFWQFYDTEYNFDGGNVEYTLDSGTTWQTLGKYWSTDSMWYNTPAIQSLDGFKPGFSGNSGGWVEAQNEFKVFGNSNIQFRFRFASNASISGEGWAIDDICLEQTGSNCETIDLDPEVDFNTRAYLYPIPARSQIFLVANLAGSHSLTIYDQRGAIVKQWREDLITGTPISISVESLPAGVYWLQLKGASEPAVMKFIKE